MDTEKESFEQSISRKLLNLEQHVINLIIPIQQLTNLIKSDDYLQNLARIQSTPIQINDKYLREVLDKFYEKFDNYKEFIKEFSSEKTLAEIKYIGKRLNDIEISLETIKEKGLKKNVELNFRCDGYELVQKPLIYDPTETKEDPIYNDKKVKELLETLTERESDVLVYTYGLFGIPKLKQITIAKKLKVTSQRIKQIKEKILRKCRHEKRKQFLKYIDNDELKSDIGILE